MRWPFGALRPHAYRVIYVDFPWAFATWSDKGKLKAPERHYRTMSLEQGMALPVAELAARDCALIAWVYDPMIPQALELIRAWDFAYKTRIFDWDQDSFGKGYVTREGGEIAFLATIGSPQRRCASVRQYYREKPREHSRKPAEFHRRIERLYPGPYCELFARSDRRGWDCWGDELGKFGSVS